jgi:hypothetical protein
VPPVKDSIQGALGYHQAWLLDTPGDVALLRDTFALACAARDWAVAENCLGRLVDLQSQGPLRSDLTEILQAAKAQAGVPSR